MILTASLRGVEARVVRVTASRRAGLRGLRIVGLAAAAERESRVRVSAALANADHFVDDEVTITCDAAGTAIDGTAIDLAAALAVCTGENTPMKLAALAELSLAGEVRPVRGVLAAVEALAGQVDAVLVAPDNAAEAALVDGVRVFAVRHLVDALRFVAGDERAVTRVSRGIVRTTAPSLDLRDVVGQPQARRALEIAAAGGHHLLLIGGPGAGKTMLARRLNGILPALTQREALDVTRVHSAAGLNVGGDLVTARPFRAPHHSTTPPGLVGGGAAQPRPGEVSLAHHGVLFLDELPEFSRPALEVLREPIATGEVVLARASGTLRFPSRCQLVASTPPCPCGRFGDRRCSCSIDSRRRYLGRIPEHLLAAIDVRVFMMPIDLSQQGAATTQEVSADVAERVVSAREQLMLVRDELDVEAARALAACESRAAYERVLRVARTVAALDREDVVRARHIDEALTVTGALPL
jgi:magnesium chelatase family protein